MLMKSSLELRHFMYSKRLCQIRTVRLENANCYTNPGYRHSSLLQGKVDYPTLDPIGHVSQNCLMSTCVAQCAGSPHNVKV